MHPHTHGLTYTQQTIHAYNIPNDRWMRTLGQKTQKKSAHTQQHINAYNKLNVHWMRSLEHKQTTKKTHTTPHTRTHNIKRQLEVVVKKEKKTHNTHNNT